MPVELCKANKAMGTENCTKSPVLCPHWLILAPLCEAGFMNFFFLNVLFSFLSFFFLSLSPWRVVFPGPADTRRRSPAQEVCSFCLVSQRPPRPTEEPLPGEPQVSGSHCLLYTGEVGAGEEKTSQSYSPRRLVPLPLLPWGLGITHSRLGLFVRRCWMLILSTPDPSYRRKAVWDSEPPFGIFQP